MRILWKSDNGVDYLEKHCGNCWHGCLAREKRSGAKLKYDCCPFKAEIVAEVDGKVLVQSTCSRIDYWYWKKVVKK